MRPTYTSALALVVVLTTTACSAESPTATLGESSPDASGRVVNAALHPTRFTGSCDVTSTVFIGISAGVLTQLSTAECRLSHLGRVTLSNLQRINLATLVQTGEATWTAANGDLLHATSLGQATPTGPGTIAFSGVATIVGGTGRFENATGSAIVEGTAEPASGTGSFTYDGWISYSASDRRRR